MSKFTERFGDMILSALQTVFGTLWGILIAALSGGIPALAGVASSYSKYGESYWRDMVPVFIAGALVGVGGFLTHQGRVQKALATPPPERQP